MLRCRDGCETKLRSLLLKPFYWQSAELQQLIADSGLQCRLSIDVNPAPHGVGMPRANPSGSLFQTQQFALRIAIFTAFLYSLFQTGRCSGFASYGQ